MNTPINPTNLRGPRPLDVMQDGREFESLLSFQYPNLNIVDEIRRSMAEISLARNGIPCLCYVANVVNSPKGNSIDGTDDLPFAEMVATVPADVTEIDIVLVTPGGVANQVQNFVNTLRPRFDRVNFILLNMAMSAGTIFIMSGDQIIMSSQSKFGPIDPQIPSKDGRFIPAQSILVAVEDINVRGKLALAAGKKPDWTDVQLLNNLDLRMIGEAITASKYSIQMTKEFLEKYKFRNWTVHHTTGNAVSSEEKKERANEIANILCNHKLWKNHGHFINRNVAHAQCKLEIVHSESIPNLDKAMRRMWALFYWIFDSTPIDKLFVSDNYCIIRNRQVVNPVIRMRP